MSATLIVSCITLVCFVQAKWELPDDVPAAPAYVIESRPGITDTYAQIELISAGNCKYNMLSD